MHRFKESAPTVADQHGEGVNAKIAVFITSIVGTMVCAYVFTGIALVSLPATIASGSLIVMVAWIAQTFLQLVLLSVIMVGQKVQSKASDAQTKHMAEGIDVVLGEMDLHTQGGLADLRDELLAEIRKSHGQT